MIKSLILYFQFFTRIPIPIAVDQPVERMASGVKYFTFFGLLMGLIEGLIFYLASFLVSFNMAWLIVLFSDVLLTGAFHLDAIADMADGLFSSRKKERILEIMKDSRVGSNGVIVLIFYYLICVISFLEISETLTLLSALFIVIGMNVVGKIGISLLFYKMTYSGNNPNGLGTVFVGVKTADIVISQLVGLLVLFLMFGYKVLLLYFFVLVFIYIYRRMAYKKIDGLNGDILGAASPLSQVVFMLVITWVIK